ncbi:MAG: ATP-dependent helicase [Candidatus Methylacidiphilales bacterium]
MEREYQLRPAGTAAPRIRYEAELNTEQFRAVTAPPGPLLVIAGAGSGKTRTLTYRVAYLVEHGVAPENILLLTFTNKAAKEMMRRVEDLVPQDFSRMWGGTFHHVGHRLLRRHAAAAHLDPGFTIFDQEDSKDLVAACIADSGFNKKDAPFPKPEVIQSVLSMASNMRADTDRTIDTHYPYFGEIKKEVAALFDSYQQRKRSSNAVDYDDLLTLSVRLLEDQSDLRERYQNQFRHLLVDEYQDTNILQAEMVALLADAHHRVMVVGDDAQSIYSWRGAHFENIIHFPDRHDGTTVIRIETNYRSTPEILALANDSISHNARQFPKELRAVKAPGTRPARVSVHDTRQQAKFVAQRVMELHETGTALAEMAVLYRSHFHSMELQMELTRRNIPFQITSGLRFFEQAHVKDLSAYLRCAVNPSDEISFKRAAQMLPGVGAASADKLWKESRTGKPWEEIKPPAKAREGWLQWAHTHQQLLNEVTTSSPDRLIRLVLDAVYEDYLKLKFANYPSRLEDLRQLEAFASGFDQTEEFLAQLSLMTNLEARPALDPSPDDEDALKLSSIHQAKGLEWRIVFLLMLCEGQFPSSRSLESDEGEEEERRLFYVAVTRAQEELYLLQPELNATRGSYGDVWLKPSRFLDELAPDLYERWKISPEPSWDGY